MESLDSCGKPIEKGSYVIYNGTGTIGKIIDIKSENNESWIKVDSTDLWYNSQFIQAIDKAEEAKIESKLKKEEAAEKVKRMKKRTFEDVDMSTELCDGGG
ncbi:MAG: DUF2098 domain-containing protein [Methanobacterium sp.]|nr:DUF2098 domain-containing protein [Methanobacterium sp.]